MALKFFIFLLIVSPFLLVDKSVILQKVEQSKDEVPQISFVNATLFEIDDQKVDKMLVVGEYKKYESKDGMSDAFLRVRNANHNSDTILAQKLIRENDLYSFEENVIFKRDEDIELTTNQLLYNAKEKIASNQASFVFKYKNSRFSGKNLYLSQNDYAISGSNVHFQINKKDL